MFLLSVAAQRSDRYGCGATWQRQAATEASRAAPAATAAWKVALYRQSRPRARVGRRGSST
eukprot:6183471-Pleurochrysis_carterae.AAC.9